MDISTILFDTIMIGSIVLVSDANLRSKYFYLVYVSIHTFDIYGSLAIRYEVKLESWKLQIAYLQL